VSAGLLDVCNNHKLNDLAVQILTAKLTKPAK
jgi:hypothetical protein